jgi:hypothetical protein
MERIVGNYKYGILNHDFDYKGYPFDIEAFVKSINYLKNQIRDILYAGLPYMDRKVREICNKG